MSGTRDDSKPEQSKRRERVLDYLHRVHDVYLPQRWLELVGDRHRVQAYQEAVERAVARESVSSVLHAGLGSALWAMLAVNAGGRRSTIAERWGHLAGLAEALIAANGLSDGIKVISKPLEELTAADLDASADLLVLDNIDCGLLGQRILPGIDRAWRHLLRPGGQVIPRGATLFVAPIELRTSTVAGFDLRPFNRYRFSAAYEELRLGEEPWVDLTEPVACCELDFTRPVAPSTREIELRITLGGLLGC